MSRKMIGLAGFLLGLAVVSAYFLKRKADLLKSNLAVSEKDLYAEGNYLADHAESGVTQDQVMRMPLDSEVAH